ncbi:hypothetical protein V8C44DRAFT_339057 [Trichoderma aethiopicum]
MQPHGRNLWSAHFCNVLGKASLSLIWHAYSLSVLQGFTVSLSSRWDVLHDLRLGLSSLFPRSQKREKNPAGER